MRLLHHNTQGNYAERLLACAAQDHADQQEHTDLQLGEHLQVELLPLGIGGYTVVVLQAASFHYADGSRR